MLTISTSTVLPETTQGLADLVKGKGAAFVASPVCKPPACAWVTKADCEEVGAPAVADAGQLLFVLAGAQKDVDKAVPFTKGVMGKAYLHVSKDDYGKASKLKIIGNVGPGRS